MKLLFYVQRMVNNKLFKELILVSFVIWNMAKMEKEHYVLFSLVLPFLVELSTIF